MIVPHLSHLRHLITPRSYGYWLTLDLGLVGLCGAWTRFSSIWDSPGTEQEKQEAIRLGLVIYADYEEVPNL